MSDTLKDIIFFDHGKKNNAFWKLSHYFNCNRSKQLYISDELKAEYCCFYHFLVGKRRSMTKRDEIEVFLKEKTKIKQGSV